VLVLTARQEVETRVRCLDRGADDLMLKPFSLHELRARCRALLRRKRETRLQCGPAIWNWIGWTTQPIAEPSRLC